MNASKPTVGSASSNACAATRRWTTSIWSWRRGFWHELGSAGGRSWRRFRYYGLIHRAARDWRVTNAALLLFAKAPALQWHPRAGLRLFRVAGTIREHGRQRNVTQVGRADPPLARAIDEAHRLAGQQIRRSERLNGLYFEETPEYPDFAWQETIVNAFAHRDYEYQGREVETWFYEDRMEVSSPGELVPPVTLALLQEGRPAHATRNPLNRASPGGRRNHARQRRGYCADLRRDGGESPPGTWRLKWMTVSSLSASSTSRLPRVGM